MIEDSRMFIIFLVAFLLLGRAREITLVLIGPTRVGKSSFVNTLSGQMVADIGEAEQIESQTINVEAFTIEVGFY